MLKMFRTKLREDIADELHDHEEAMMEEYMHLGVSRPLAQQRARLEFGDRQTIERDCMLFSSPFSFARFGLRAFVTTYFGVLSLMLAVEYVAATTLMGTQTEWFLLWWVFIGITMLVFVGARWIMDAIGFASARVVWVPLLFISLASFSLTSILDIDNFEVTIHAILFLVIAGLVVHVGMRFWNIRTTQRIILATGIIVILATLREQPLFQFFGGARCLFITPSDVPLNGLLAACTQVSLRNRVLFPLHLLLLAGIPSMIVFVVRYWRQGTIPLLRKIFFTAMLATFMVAPLFVPEVNSKGEFDIVPYKPAIHRAYMKILGRAPEEKDYTFYATTRAYEHFDRIEETLFQSRERVLKIHLITNSIVGRDATAEELAFYTERRLGMKKIQKELRRAAKAAQ